MQRPILVPASQPGITSYTLSSHDAFTVKAVSALLDNSAGGNSIMPMLYVQEPSGGLPYLQQLGYINNTCFMSLGARSEPFGIDNNANVYYPQTDVSGDSTFRTQRMEELTLYTGCTIGITTPAYNSVDPTNPLSGLDTGWTVSNFLLWVEDTGAVQAAQFAATLTVGPFQLVPGPQA